jgi:hypothetical protein
VDNAVTISGGTFEVAIGGSATGVLFGAGGTLQLDGSQIFGGTVAGFAAPALIDLRDISFTSGVTTAIFTEAPSNLSGTLMVSSGVAVANITLLGQFMTAQFHLTSDGHGGTLVSDPAAATSFDQAVIAPHHHA